MAYIVNNSDSSFYPVLFRRMRQVSAAAFLLSLAVVVATLFGTGHPFLGGWAVMAVFGLLFVMGAGRVTERRDEG